MPSNLVYAGFSLGAMPAQKLLSLADYDERAAGLVRERVRRFLEDVG